jgi:hypothetical protein
MSKVLVDMSKIAITARLRRVGALSDLSPQRRMEGKIDMSPAAITARLREAAALLDVWRSLAQAKSGKSEP